MATVARAEAVITAQNKLRPGLSSAARDLDAFRRTQTRAVAGLNQAAGQFRHLDRMERTSALLRGGIGTLAAGLGAGAGLQKLKEATARFADVDRAMARTGITGDATVEQTRRGTEQLRAMARETGTLFDPAQKGLDAITASGRDFTDAMKMMPSVLKTAQASGAGVDDIANSSTALIDHMKISIAELGAAQDTLAMGGKLGKFELKDMARYLPSMLPAYKAIGKSGQEGLRNLVAMLQVIRSGTGSAEEAASSAQNIFAKMESEQTVKNFKDMGVDLPKAMKKARAEGKDLLDVFLDLSNQALKGDLSKVPQLFKDMEVQRGMRPLLAGMQKMLELRQQLQGAGGTIDKDFLRISADARATLDRFKEAADRAKTSLGSLASEAGSPAFKSAGENLNSIAEAMERAAEAARSEGFVGAVKRIVGDVIDGASKSAAEGREGMGRLAVTEPDRLEASRIARRGEEANGGPRDLYADKNLEEDIEREREILRLAPEGSIRKRAEERLAELERKRNGVVKSIPLSDAELKSVARDQQRLAGLHNLPELNFNSREAEAAGDMARERQRGAAWSASPSRPPSVASGAPVVVLDDVVSRVSPAAAATAPAPPPAQSKGWLESFRAGLDQFRADMKPGLDRMKWQPVDPAPLAEAQAKVADVRTTIESLGPVGASAGTALGTGISSGLSQAEAAVAASVARMQQTLNTLRMPSLSFGTGAGGLPVGRSMPEVR
jgi:TP901 family phage tail tape measure protein